MTRPFSLTLRQGHHDMLRSWLLPSTGSEGAALFLCHTARIACDPWSRSMATRFLVREIVHIDRRDIVSASAQHITVSTRPLRQVLRRAREEGLVAGYVHSHPYGPAWFSEQDDRDEPLLAELSHHRNGASAPFITMLMTGDGQLLGRTWLGDNVTPFEMIRTVGDRIGLHYDDRFSSETPAAFHRQALAFGPALTKDISTLRIGISGAGATGSATAVLLARLGARRMAIFDDDTVDETNLSRLHGATRLDIGRPKVEVLKEHLEGFGLVADVVAFQHWIDDPACRDALKSCDVIFGCTDDHAGRMFLNRFAYFYLVPVIDMGIDIGLDGSGRILNADARVTTVGCGSTCLMCRGVIDPQRAYEELLLRNDPEEYRRREKERYVRGAGNPNPAVAHFTTNASTMAIDELVHRLTGYRKVTGVDHRVRKFQLLEDKRPGAATDGECAICGDQNYWGRGDVEPFLDRVG